MYCGSNPTKSFFTTDLQKEYVDGRYTNSNMMTLSVVWDTLLDKEVKLDDSLWFSFHMSDGSLPARLDNHIAMLHNEEVLYLQAVMEL